MSTTCRDNALFPQVEIQARKELPIPSAWGVDRDGKVGHIPTVQYIYYNVNQYDSM